MDSLLPGTLALAALLQKFAPELDFADATLVRASEIRPAFKLVTNDRHSTGILHGIAAIKAATAFPWFGFPPEHKAFLCAPPHLCASAIKFFRNKSASSAKNPCSSVSIRG